MKEKVEQNLIVFWHLVPTEDMLKEIESTCGFEKFLKSYHLQLEFSKKHGGAMSNLK